VAAQTGHNVTVVDVSEDVLKKSKDSIKKSLERVAKKQNPEDEKVANLCENIIVWLVCLKLLF